MLTASYCLGARPLASEGPGIGLGRDVFHHPHHRRLRLGFHTMPPPLDTRRRSESPVLY